MAINITKTRNDEQKNPTKLKEPEICEVSPVDERPESMWWERFVGKSCRAYVSFKPAMEERRSDTIITRVAAGVQDSRTKNTSSYDGRTCSDVASFSYTILVAHCIDFASCRIVCVTMPSPVLDLWNCFRGKSCPVFSPVLSRPSSAAIPHSSLSLTRSSFVPRIATPL